jgi:hypothetical protein
MICVSLCSRLAWSRCAPKPGLGVSKYARFKLMEFGNFSPQGLNSVSDIPIAHYAKAACSGGGFCSQGVWVPTLATEQS